VSKFVINHSLPNSEGETIQNINSKMEVEGQEKPLKYDLFAISNHFGSLSGGHYTAYCK
jgi:ubiquitin C-terminal hydrolase